MLCGHSYGGMVITEVGARLTSKIRAIVYLDAFLPSDDESVLDLARPERQKDLIGEAGKLGGFAVPLLTAAQMNVNEKDRSWVDRLCTNNHSQLSFKGLAQSPRWRTFRGSTSSWPNPAGFSGLMTEQRIDPVGHARR